jgi:hypothetical protein
MPQFMRAYCQRAEASKGKPGDPIRFVASSEGIKRDGKSLKAANWQLENYRKNPVFLWVHDYYGRTLPLGRAEANIEGDQLMADTTFDQEDEFARQVEGKYRRGYLNTVSVGWDDVANCPNCGARVLALYGLSFYRLECKACGRELPKDIEIKYELLDISAVPVPGDPDALIERQYRAWQSIFDKQNPAERGESDAVGLTWEEAAVLMLRVFDPGSRMTDTERRAAYNRAERFYRSLGRKAPELLPADTLTRLGPTEILGLFFEGEPAIFPALFTEQRAGAVLNSRNRADVEQIRSLAEGVLERSTKAEDQDSDKTKDETKDDGERAVELLKAVRARFDSLLPA